MSQSLNPNGMSVGVGNVILRTPGLAGTATVTAASPAGARGAAIASDPLHDALLQEGLQPFQTIAIAGAHEVDAGANTTRSMSSGQPAFEVEVQDPGSGWGQLILQEEGGIATWHFARDSADHIDAGRGQTRRTYVIPRYVLRPSGGGAETRGILGTIGNKILTVLVFPLIDRPVGQIAAGLVQSWEDQKRPYRIRSFGPADYSSSEAETIDRGGWARLAKGRALLMIHGTGSLTHTGFGLMPKEFVESLNRLYDNRVFAFDHQTLAQTPLENVTWLVEQIPDATELELDIVCHSRGGLVARVMSEQQAHLQLGERRLNVKNIVFVGTPNLGTRLTDTKYLNTYIDAYTNLLNLFPTNGVTDILQAVITIAKGLAAGVVKGLDGLESMVPTGRFLAELNTGPTHSATYHALASNYQPNHPALAAWAQNCLIDSIFAANNDLIVPTDGVFAANGSGNFPVAEHYVIPPESAVQHCDYFSHPDSLQRILDWLTAAAPRGSKPLVTERNTRRSKRRVRQAASEGSV